MDERAKQMMRECSIGSIDGTLTFPDVVSRLASIGCEAYHADFSREEKTYYTRDGESFIHPLPLSSRAVPEAFASEEIVAALRTIQRGEISYKAFLDRIRAAGCAGYIVFIAGRRTVYFGRRGDLYVEEFPSPAMNPVQD